VELSSQIANFDDLSCSELISLIKAEGHNGYLARHQRQIREFLRYKTSFLHEVEKNIRDNRLDCSIAKYIKQLSYGDLLGLAQKCGYASYVERHHKLMVSYLQSFHKN
jgi:hypothetical protein